jgi:phosphatidylglycerol lysyltransferase
MRAQLVRLLRGASRHPLTLFVAVAAAGAGLARLGWAGEVELEGAWFSVLSWLILLASLAAAERIFGSCQTAIIATLATAIGVVVSWAVLTAGSALGEQFSQEALRYPPWTPSVTSAALLMAVSGRLRPASRRTVRWAVVTGAIALLLISGHSSDAARGVAVLAGAVAGIVGHRVSPGESWRPGSRARWRGVLASALIVIASALGSASVTPSATGVLAWAGSIVDPVFGIVAAGLLVVGAALILTGRPLGLLVGGGALAVVAAIALTRLVIVPVVTGEVVWSGLSGADVEWQLIALISGVVPASVVLLLALRARAVLRRPAPEPTAHDRDRLSAALRAGGDGTFAHMATWAGNSLWFGADGSAIAYRVRDGVAFTLGGPIGGCPGEAGRAFADHCERHGWTPVFYSVHDETAGALERAGWARTPVGTEAIIDTADFSLQGKKRQDLRTAVNRAGREGIVAVWTTYSETVPATRAQIDALCSGGMAGKRLPEMGFTLGGLPELADPEVRLMLAVGADGRVHAVTSWLPRFREGVVVGWTLDVMRRCRDAMPGAMEFAIVSAIRRAAEDGVARVSLSGTPLAPHDGAALGPLSRRLVRLLEPAYGFASLERFKAKFGARTEPLWMFYPQPMQLGRIAPALVRVYIPDLRLRGVIGALRGSA